MHEWRSFPRVHSFTYFRNLEMKGQLLKSALRQKPLECKIKDRNNEHCCCLGTVLFSGQDTVFFCGFGLIIL